MLKEIGKVYLAVWACRLALIISAVMVHLLHTTLAAAIPFAVALIVMLVWTALSNCVDKKIAGQRVEQREYRK